VFLAAGGPRAPRAAASVRGLADSASQVSRRMPRRLSLAATSRSEARTASACARATAALSVAGGAGPQPEPPPPQQSGAPQPGSEACGAAGGSLQQLPPLLPQRHHHWRYRGVYSASPAPLLFLRMSGTRHQCQQ
jgi:hypothetical protein